MNGWVFRFDYAFWFVFVLSSVKHTWAIFSYTRDGLTSNIHSVIHTITNRTQYSNEFNFLFTDVNRNLPSFYLQIAAARNCIATCLQVFLHFKGISWARTILFLCNDSSAWDVISSESWMGEKNHIVTYWFRSTYLWLINFQLE